MCSWRTINAAGSALHAPLTWACNQLDEGTAIAVDSSGNAYGDSEDTSSTNFPTTNPLQASNGGGNGDAFVTKIDASGSAIIYSTYFRRKPVRGC